VGAVYNPFTTVPRFGFNDQLTAVLVVPETVGVTCSDWPDVRVPEVGDNEMLTGVTGALNNTVAEATSAESASLVAVIVTWVSAVIDAGAV
jgi:hypothetical protein